MRAQRLDAAALPLAVTMGDPAGIGPDVILASWLARKQHALRPFVVYGDAEIMRQRAMSLGLDAAIASLGSLGDACGVFADALPVYSASPGPPGSARREDAAIVAAIENATAAVAGGEALALVTGPIAKKSLRGIALEYPGHTAFLGQLASRYWSGRFRPTMML